MILELFDAGAVHLRCPECGWEHTIAPDIPEGMEFPAGVRLTTVLLAAGNHECDTREPPIWEPRPPSVVAALPGPAVARLELVNCATTDQRITEVRLEHGCQQPYHEDGTPCTGHNLRVGT